MTDIFDKEKRSEIMSKIRSRDTKPELLFKERYPAAVYQPGWLPYHPDFIVKGKLVFLDSSFWHGFITKDKYDRLPEYWKNKLFRNIVRDECANTFYDVLRIIKRVLI